MVGGLWGLLWVYFQSGAGIDLGVLGFFVAIAWVLAAFGLGCFWIAVVVVTFLALIKRNGVRARRTAGFLVPLAALAALVLTPGISGLPLRTAFRMSDEQLIRVADRYDQTGWQETGWAGVYHVNDVWNWDDCTMIETSGGGFLEAGFARCSAPPADDWRYGLEFEHVEHDWWRYERSMD